MIATIILSAGSGSRFGDQTPKQFAKLAGKPVLVHTLELFERSPDIDDIIIVSNEDKLSLVWEYVRKFDLRKVKKVVAGGKTRQESSKIGLDCCGEKTKYVLIHDGVRPFVSRRIIDNLIRAVKKYKAVDTVIPSADTIVEVDENSFISKIPDRSFLRRGQTPQAFEYKLIKEAHEKALRDGIRNSTDDCALVLRLGHPVYTIAGNEENIKITYPLDLHIADKLFQLRNQTIPWFDREYLEDVFNDKVFVIVGGTSGIGKSLAETLQGLSKSVYALGRKIKPRFDITNTKSVENGLSHIFEKEGKIDFIINCAGDLLQRNVEFMEEKEWDHIYDTNIKGVFLLSKCALKYFKKQGFGYLMFIGSSSYTRGRGGYAAYSSSKAALVNFCQALAEEVYEYNIKVNVVSPGRVATPLRYRNFGKEDPKTLLSPEYVAEKILMSLLVDTTGSVFEINGNEKNLVI